MLDHRLQILLDDARHRRQAAGRVLLAAPLLPAPATSDLLAELDELRGRHG